MKNIVTASYVNSFIGKVTKAVLTESFNKYKLTFPIEFRSQNQVALKYTDIINQTYKVIDISQAGDNVELATKIIMQAVDQAVKDPNWIKVRQEHDDYVLNDMNHYNGGNWSGD